jgi:hypothetical protein
VVRAPISAASTGASVPVRPTVETAGHFTGAGASGFGWIWLVLLIGVVGVVWWFARPVVPEVAVDATASHPEIHAVEDPVVDEAVVVVAPAVEESVVEVAVVAESVAVDAVSPVHEPAVEIVPAVEVVAGPDRIEAPAAEWMSPLLETQQAMRAVLDEQRRQGEELAARLAGLEETRSVLAGLGAELAAVRAVEPPALEVPEAFGRDIERMEAEMALLREALTTQREAMQSLAGRMEGLDTIARAARDLTRAMKRAPVPVAPAVTAPGSVALPDALTETLARMNETVVSLRDDVLTHREVLMDLNAQVADLGRLPTNILYVSGVMTRHPTTVLYRSRVVLFPAKPEPAAPVPEATAAPVSAPEPEPAVPLVIHAEPTPEPERQPEPDDTDNPAARLDGPVVLSPASFGRQSATTVYANDRYFSPTRTVKTTEEKAVFSPSDFTLP